MIKKHCTAISIKNKNIVIFLVFLSDNKYKNITLQTKKTIIVIYVEQSSS